MFGPNGNIIGGTSIIGNYKGASILLSANNRLTIQEEDDDDLQSIGNGGYIELSNP